MPSKYGLIDPTAYGCKFDRNCPGFSVEKYRCTHGGGRLCNLWRKYLNYEMGASNTRPKFKNECSEWHLKKYKVQGL